MKRIRLWPHARLPHDLLHEKKYRSSCQKNYLLLHSAKPKIRKETRWKKQLQWIAEFEPQHDPNQRTIVYKRCKNYLRLIRSLSRGGLPTFNRDNTRLRRRNKIVEISDSKRRGELLRHLSSLQDRWAADWQSASDCEYQRWTRPNRERPRETREKLSAQSGNFSHLGFPHRDKRTQRRWLLSKCGPGGDLTRMLEKMIRKRGEAVTDPIRRTN